MSSVIAGALSIFFGFSSGIILATGILAFITVIGVIPRITEKADIRTHYRAIGTAATLGIIMGSLLSLFEVHFTLPKILIAAFGLLMGMFIGCLAVALAEVLDVIPITKRRFKIKQGIWLIIVAFSIGKLVGSLYYWFYPGFNIS